MEASQVQKIMSAFESADIKKFAVTDDVTGHYYNNDNEVTVADMSNELFVNFKKGVHTGVNSVSEDGNVLMSMIPFIDTHIMKFTGTYNQVKQVAESLGLSLDDNQNNIILNIDKKNYDIKPATGDYVSRFHYLSEKQYAELSEEEKAQYDAEKKEYEDNKAKYIGQNMAASISL